ncbi:MAG: Coenzyme F420 hydrogenase/dehydrogenase, beta subunit C-terminal domain [Eubacteriales bacterium]
MIHITNPQDCCGCTACASICVRHAITMKPDALGFLYPEVDKDKCIHCGLCEKVCAFNDNYDKSLNFPEPIAYGARHKDIHEVETSRSGAAFIAFSDWVLEQGGVVYGAGYKDYFRVVHKRAITKRQRDEFKGSKYVQSDMNTVFLQVRNDLKKGMIVLFSGTPCQTSGLNSFIGNELREQLYLIDIVCHGVPGPYVWRDYMTYLEKKEGKKIVAVNFRDKSKFGWNAHKESFQYKGDSSYTSYTYIFYSHIMFRHSCYFCHFTNLKRPSDVTIADFWGWEKTDKLFNADDKGCSLILCNTEKGKVWFAMVQNKLNFFSAKVENCIQPNLRNPSPINRNRNKFEKNFVKYGFEHVLKQYGNLGFKYKVRLCIAKIKKNMKDFIGI